MAVRSCVARLLVARLRHARGQAVDAFRRLIATDDRLLTTRQILDLMTYIGLGEPEAIEPVIEACSARRMPRFVEAGGWMAAIARLDLGLGHLLTTIRASQDAHTRNGAARLCAHRPHHTSDAAAAAATLAQLVNDDDADVRKAAAGVAGVLHGQALRLPCHSEPEAIARTR